MKKSFSLYLFSLLKNVLKIWAIRVVIVFDLNLFFLVLMVRYFFVLLEFFYENLKVV